MTSTESRLLVKEAPPSWIARERCGYLNYRRRLERGMFVCPACGQHLRLSAAQRIRMLLDPGSAQPLTLATTVCDPLSFTDTRNCQERLRVAQDTTGLEDAVLIAAGTVDGQPVVVARASSPPNATPQRWKASSPNRETGRIEKQTVRHSRR